MKRLSLACGSGVKLFTLGTSVNLKFWLWFIQLLYIANVSALFPYLERSQNSTFKCLDLSSLQKADEECYQSARALFTGNRLNMGVPERWSTIWSYWCWLCPHLLCDFTGLHASYAALSFFKHAFNDTLLLSAAGKETFNNLRLKHAALKRKQLCLHWRVSGRQKKTQRKRGGGKKQEAEHEWAEGKRGLTDRRGPERQRHICTCLASPSAVLSPGTLTPTAVRQEAVTSFGCFTETILWGGWKIGFHSVLDLFTCYAPQ